MKTFSQFMLEAGEYYGPKPEMGTNWSGSQAKRRERVDPGEGQKFGDQRADEKPVLRSIHYINPEATKQYDPQNQEHVTFMKGSFGAKYYDNSKKWGIPIYSTSGRRSLDGVHYANQSFGIDNIKQWFPRSAGS